MRVWLVVVSLGVVVGAPAADEVTSLPGYNGTLPSKHFSGYVAVGNETAMLHYWLQESENDPASDPTVFWLNGGPGSSGVLGLLTELGQVLTIPVAGSDEDMDYDDDAGGEVPRLYRNPYAWTKVANVFTIEQPKGVGYSYCVSQPCVNTDESTAEETREALAKFFQLYPELLKNDFYIVGESYAGVYIPMLIDQIDAHPENIPTLTGAMIGNGCWGSDCFYGVHEAEIDTHTFEGHHMISQSLASEIYERCGRRFSNLTANEGTCGGEPARPSLCKASLDKLCKQAGDGGFNVYNVYDTCYPRDNLASIRHVLRTSKKFDVDFHASFKTHPQLHLVGQVNDYSCGSETKESDWLSSSSVMAALHVNTTGRMTYLKTAGDLRSLYAKLIPKHRMLIYSGSVDACVPTYGSETWTSDLGYQIDTDWHAWHSPSASPGSSPNPHAGYAIKYATNNFTFITVHGAGHEVPRYKPDFALTMLTKFLSSQDF